jgi:hypothetical protein
MLKDYKITIICGFGIAWETCKKAQFFSCQSENGISKLQTSPSSADVIQLASTQKGDNIMQKLVPGTEGSSTLVGTLETIKKPLVGFIRLTEATFMPNLMEVPIPGVNLNYFVQKLNRFNTN